MQQARFQYRYNARTKGSHWVAAILLIGSTGSGGLCWSQALPAVSWQLADERITLNEPVILKLSVENTTRDSVVLNLGDDFEGRFLITIITPQGTVLHRPPRGTGNRIAVLGRVQIEPGAVYIRNYTIDEWHGFDSPGKYGIGVTPQIPVTVGDRSDTLSAETYQTITIGAADETALRRRCEELLAIAFKTHTVVNVDTIEKADQALHALSSVRDPIVIPYLARAVISPTLIVQDRAAVALTRFSTPEAITALLGT